MKQSLLFTFLLVLAHSTVYSFQNSQTLPALSEKSEKRQTFTISEDHFDCFKTLQCLLREVPVTINNMNDIRLTHNRTDRIRVKGSNEKINLEAVYNGNGHLIKSTIILRNVALPRSVTTILVSGEFTSWQMIGNEVAVENFNSKTIQYKVILKRGDDVKIEYFNNMGELQNRFS